MQNKDIKIDDIDLVKIFSFFNTLIDEQYCLVKKASNFPNLNYGDDIDLVVENIDSFKNKFIEFFSKYDDYFIDTTSDKNNKLQFDLKKNNNLIIKFDLHFKKYDSPKFRIKKNFYADLFSNLKNYSFFINNKKFLILVPVSSFELLIRLLEYAKYPHKKHHKKFIVENINSENNFEIFLEQYVDLDINYLLKSNYYLLATKNIFSKIYKRSTRLFKNSFISKLFLRKLSYKKENRQFIDIGWTNVRVSSSVKIQVKKIYVNLKHLGKLKKVRIEDTPHYVFIKSVHEGYKHDDIYKNYLLDNFEEFNEENVENKIQQFINLLNDYKKNEKFLPLIIANDKNLYLKSKANLIDGVHRLSIMNLFNKQNVKCYIKDN